MNIEPSAEENAPADPLLGAVLKETWRVLDRLGAGGMGVVYRGEHVLIGRVVAIKFLRWAMEADAVVVERFHREARASARIGNEHVVDVLDFGRLPNGTPFMVMELLEGVELGELIAGHGALPLGRALHIVDQLCEALAVVHRSGIVHRDLKPENIFLVRRGRDADFVKVLDFGISKFHAAEEGAVQLTRSAAVMGSVRYMSPEQARGTRDVDARTDLYAVGAILYHCLTGQPPYPEESFMAVLFKAAHDPVPDVRALRPELPAGLSAVITRALAKSASDRYPDCDSLREALAPFALDGDLSLSHTAPAALSWSSSQSLPPAAPVASSVPALEVGSRPSTAPESPVRRSRTDLLVALAALAVLASVGVGALMPRRDARPVSTAPAPSIIAPPPPPPSDLVEPPAALAVPHPAVALAAPEAIRTAPPRRARASQGTAAVVSDAGPTRATTPPGPGASSLGVAPGPAPSTESAPTPARAPNPASHIPGVVPGITAPSDPFASPGGPP
jgi:serine/threonine-protein kinase